MANSRIPVLASESGLSAYMSDIKKFPVLDVQEEWGVTVLLVEHDMGMVMDISGHVVVLNFGEVIASGTPANVRVHPQVIEAYLGAATAEQA